MALLSIQSNLAKSFFQKLLAIYLLLSSTALFAQVEIDSLTNFKLNGPVKSMTVKHFRISPEGDTTDAYVPTGPHVVEFYPVGMLKEKQWSGYSGETVRKVVVNHVSPRKISVVHYQEELVESWFSYEFNELDMLEKSVESRGNGHLEKTEFIYDGTKLKERLVYEQDALLSHFKYEYTDGQTNWAVKEEFNSSGSFVDSKSQTFDDKNRLIRFRATDAEEGEIEDRSITYFEDGTRITVVRLNEGTDQGLVRIDSTIEMFVDGFPVEKSKYDERNRLIKQTKWGYNNGKVQYKVKLNADSDTLSLTTYDHQSNGRVIERQFNSNADLLRTLETDTDINGRRTYFCVSEPELEKSIHYTYNSFDDLIETLTREINEAEFVDVTTLQKRRIEYYEQ